MRHTFLIPSLSPCGAFGIHRSLLHIPFQLASQAGRVHGMFCGLTINSREETQVQTLSWEKGKRLPRIGTPTGGATMSGGLDLCQKEIT